MSHRPAPDNTERIIDVLRSLSAGEVVSYGDVAEVAGASRRARLVGRILAAGTSELPWWRVVTADGRLVPGAEREHERLLEAEGVVVRGRRVVWSPSGRFSRRPGPTGPSSP